MSWFLLALICTIGWGCADLFYKKGSDNDDRFSHLKIAVWVGLVMGLCSLVLIPFSESFGSSTGSGIGEFLLCVIKYSPASLCYIVSMVIGYAGLRYLELSIASPVQNASGAFSAVAMFVFFAFTGGIASVADEFSALDIIGTVFVVAGVVALAFTEQKLAKDETVSEPETRKYRYGALALLFPILYCLFDTIGTAADGIILSGTSSLELGEIDILILYGLTFMAAGVAVWVYMLLKTGKPYNPFMKREMPKCTAAICEEFGQIFYIFAMASRPMLAAPMVASYCIVSVLLSRIFLREKLPREQIFFIVSVIIGILLLGISEGISA